MSDPNWGQWVRDNRKAKRMRRRDLANKACIDTSYVTLIERDGYVPRREIASRLGRALVGDPDRGEVMAGFCPVHLRKHLLTQRAASQRRKSPAKDVSK